MKMQWGRPRGEDNARSSLELIKFRRAPGSRRQAFCAVLDSSSPFPSVLRRGEFPRDLEAAREDAFPFPDWRDKLSGSRVRPRPRATFEDVLGRSGTFRALASGVPKSRRVSVTRHASRQEIGEMKSGVGRGSARSLASTSFRWPYPRVSLSLSFSLVRGTAKLGTIRGSLFSPIHRRWPVTFQGRPRH